MNHLVDSALGDWWKRRRRRDVANTYTAIIKRDGDWWIGWIEEVAGVNCQERTREELLQTLKVTLKEALEFNRKDAISAATSDYTEEPVSV
jgi:predicted RNase H-like HicB family nuclease